MFPPPRASAGARRRRQAGQGIVEYGLILGGAAVVMYVTLAFLGPILADVLSLIGAAIDAATDGR